MVPITALYAALLVAVFVWLSYKVGVMRGKTGISILHGDDMELAEVVRRHGNFVEAVPFALILMGIVEANGGNGVFLHVVGVLLVACRIVHPLGLHHDRAPTPMRAIGAGGTFLLTIALGGMALWQGLGAL